MKMMKNLIAVFTICCSLLLSANAANAENIGVISIEAVYANYTKAQDIASDAKVQEAELQKFIAEAQKKIKKETSPVSRKNLEEKLSKEFQAKSKKANEVHRAKLQKVQTTLFNTIKQVATEKKLDIVVERGSVLYGGEDITKDVISKLNSKK